MGGTLLIGRDFSEAEGICDLCPCLCMALATLPQHPRMWHLEEQGRSPRWGQGMLKACVNIPKVERDQAGFSST